MDNQVVRQRDRQTDGQADRERERELEKERERERLNIKWLTGKNETDQSEDEPTNQPIKQNKGK